MLSKHCDAFEWEVFEMSEEILEKVTIVNVLDDGKHHVLFGETGVRYVIPIYQRAFAWGVKKSDDINYQNEIEQLMDDIYDLDCEKKNYYLGSLVVWKRPDSRFEVIDGQQRLTALCILLKCLGKSGCNISFTPPLDYDRRKKSELAMREIDAIIDAIKGKDWSAISEVTLEKEKKQWKVLDEDLENSMCDAVQTIFSRFDEEEKGYPIKLFENLKKVRLFRIEVPPDTDLNKYFEIMNVRGRQLEQSDIVKARLMGWLESDKKKEWFARIWNACRDMSGYVQMHFEKKVRTDIFGSTWNEPPNEETVLAAMENEKDPMISIDSKGTKEMTILDALLNPDAGSNAIRESEEDSLRDDDDGERFGSILEFPQFLLHVLKVFRKKCDDTTPTDAQVLAGKFEEDIGEPENDNGKAERAWDFILCLLRCRFLFDRYFIKRDYNNGSSDGEWSLRILNRTDDRHWNYRGPMNFEECLMIQSCLRVTYTNPKLMHWITRLLGWVCAKEDKNIDLANIASWCEKFAIEEAKEDWKALKTANYRLGTKTSHLLFNYLDYILWKKDPKQPFVFEFRNSVEHWYPQNPDPKENALPVWDDKDGQGHLDRDRFGNLCLLTVKMNSRFSNLPPVSKARYDKMAKQNGSMKYRAMIDIMESLDYAKADADARWRKEECEKHEKTMLEILQSSLF